jgi:hypothetical protein
VKGEATEYGLAREYHTTVRLHVDLACFVLPLVLFLSSKAFSPRH